MEAVGFPHQALREAEEHWRVVQLCLCPQCPDISQHHLPPAPGSTGLQPRPLLGTGSCCWKGRHGSEGDKEVPVKLLEQGFVQ